MNIKPYPMWLASLIVAILFIVAICFGLFVLFLSLKYLGLWTLLIIAILATWWVVYMIMWDKERYEKTMGEYEDW